MKTIGFGDIATPLIVTLLSAAALFVLRAVTFRVLRRWAERTESRVDDAVLHALRVPSAFWCLALALSAGVGFSGLTDRQTAYVTRAVLALVILSVAFAAANIAGKLFSDFLRKSELPVPGTGLANGILKGTIHVIGFLVLLSALGISVTPILTALGVGGLAVALALQDTLSNLFAGIHVLVEKPLRVGDFVRLESGEEGYVEDITWRTTRIRTLPNNMVIVPNGKVARSTLTNYCLPEKRMSLLIRVSVSYASDPERVEAVLVDTAKGAAGEIPGLLGEPEPFAQFIPGFGDSSLDFTLVCQVGEFVDQFPVQHELRKRIFARLKEEGIGIPFPHRTVYLKEDTPAGRSAT